MRAARLAALGVVLLALPACGIFATESDHEALAGHVKERDQALDERFKQLTAELAATRDRLDNALRANADHSSDVMSDQARLNQLSGRMDEVSHGVDELKSIVAASRTEIDARFDAIKRAQDAQATPAPPPVAIPPDKAAHYAAILAAIKSKDNTLLRTLGHEYVNRYGTDDKADDVLYFMGSADLAEDRPSSALGEFNRILKLYPRSDVLDRTLFGMGEAYFTIHDCENAKLAFTTCASRFAKEKVGVDAKARITAIEKAPPGTCAPP